MLFLKLLLLLWSINFAPPLMAQLFEQRWNIPIDGDRLFADGHPLFGPHKTIRGVLAGILMGMCVGIVLGFPYWLGLGAGALSMAGDLFSSFLKRRLSFISGDVVPGLDQTPEGLFPFLILGPYFSLSLVYVVFCLAVFATGAYFGSIFLSHTLMRRPFASYPRPVRPKTRFRELISCQITTAPFYQILNFEDALYYHFLMETLFKAMGIYERGKSNALVLERKDVSFHFSDLPPAFDGYRILFLTDLHLDGLDGLTDRLLDIIRDIRADICILGGDFRMETHGPFADAMTQLDRVLPQVHVTEGVYGVLGNHDCIEIMDALEGRVTFMVNSSLKLQRNGEQIWLVGIDDPHYFKCHDLDQAFDEVPDKAFSILISHSNEIYKAAREYGPKLFLCGHTHAGQIRIPPIGPVFTHSSAPRSLCEGRWEYGGMLGYTSAGVGVSGVPVRYNSKGEVTVITLHRA